MHFILDASAGESSMSTGARPDPSNESKNGSFVKGCLVTIVVVVALGALCFVALVGALVLSAVAGAGGGPSGPVQLREARLSGPSGASKVAVIPVQGVIHGGASSGAELTPVSLTIARLNRAARDSRVEGVLLVVDSPGGGITASDVLHRRIKQFRERDGKPVVVLMGDLAASGGYYIAAATDKIVAHPTTVTGSIGVMMPLYDMTGLMEKVGVRDESITTGPFKDIGSPFVEKTEEQRRKEREILRGIIDSMYERFIEVVAQGRGLDPAAVRDLADGRIFTSAVAREKGLIDMIGYRSDAVKVLKDISGAKQVQLVEYRRVLSMSDVITSFASGPEVNVRLPRGLDLLPYSRPMYLWLPPERQSLAR
jgi:protease-4